MDSFIPLCLNVIFKHVLLVSVRSVKLVFYTNLVGIYHKIISEPKSINGLMYVMLFFPLKFKN